MDLEEDVVESDGHEEIYRQRTEQGLESDDRLGQHPAKNDEGRHDRDEDPYQARTTYRESVRQVNESGQHRIHDRRDKGETYDADGMTWGLEVKHYGRWAYENILKKGLEEAAPDVVAQCALYGDALGWDACLVVVTSQDASSIRSDITRNRKAKNPAIRWADRPGIHPKVTLVALDLRPLYETLVPVLKHRAEWFTQWKEQDGNPANVKWEIYPGDDKFPWSYSEEGYRYWDGVYNKLVTYGVGKPKL